jgi:acetyl-CoA carboxylase carboxyl transferase subunit alpha
MKRYVLDFERPVVELEIKLAELKKSPSASKPDIAKEIAYLESQIEKLKIKIYSKLTPWQKVQVARHPDRPRTLDYVEAIFTDFLELKGDRTFGDDPAIIAGFARLDSRRLVVIGHHKGKNAKENVARNFGMPHPEGFRKALRVLRLASKFKLPVVSFIDTAGAYPGIGAEERGQALAIAQNLAELAWLPVPIICVNIGEGGSGGALAIGVGDCLLMLENAYFSVISPEGCASILWRDGSKADLAASALSLTADILQKHGFVDEIIKEPLGGAHKAPALVMRETKKLIEKWLNNLSVLSEDELLKKRYKKLRNIGFFKE